VRRKMREAARICLIVRTTDLDPLSSGKPSAMQHSRVKTTFPRTPHDSRFQHLSCIRWPLARPTESLRTALLLHWNVHFLSTLKIMARYQSSPHEQ